MNKAEELIACLEGEIAKRDARIVELESAAESLRLSRDYHHEQEIEYRRRWAGICTAQVSEANAQGVVQWPDADEIMQMAFEDGQPADDASGYCFELEEFDLFIERLMSEVARLNATHVQQPKCKTCDDNGRIGGPSFYAPDEGGEPCPDCSAHAQQVSVPDGWKLVPVERITIALESVQNAMEDAYNNAYQECCGRGQGQCCGDPVAAWSDADTAIMDALAPAQRELSALLAAAPAAPEQ